MNSNCWTSCYSHVGFWSIMLTLLMLKPGYSRKIKSIPWLLMPWLLYHQAINCQLCSMNKSCLPLRILLLPSHSQCKYIFIFPKINSALQGLTPWINCLLVKFEAPILIWNCHVWWNYHQARLFYFWFDKFIELSWILILPHHYYTSFFIKILITSYLFRDMQ